MEKNHNIVLDEASAEDDQPRGCIQPVLPAPVAAIKPFMVVSAHGARQDPYYWLGDFDSGDAGSGENKQQAIAYLQAENLYYQHYTASYAALTRQLTDEMIGRLQQDDSTVPAVKGDYSYAVRFAAGQEYPLYVRTHLSTGVTQVMLDVNELAAGKDYYHIENYQVSPCQQWLAYAESLDGRLSYRIKIRDLLTGKDLADEIPDAEAGVAWSADSRHLYFIAQDQQTLLGREVRRHQLGADVSLAELLYQEQDTSFYLTIRNSQDGQFIMINSSSTVSGEVWVLKANEPTGVPRPLATRQRGIQYHAEHHRDRWLILTDWQAPNYCVMTVADEQIGDRSRWQPLIAHDPAIFIDNFCLFDDFLVLEERSEGLERIRFMPWADLTKASYIDCDEPVFVAYASNNLRQNTCWFRYCYSSLTTPDSIFEVNMQTGEKRLLKQQVITGGFDRNHYQTERFWAKALDGSSIPVSLLYKKGLKKDGSAPLYQYAYGSYGISVSPAFHLPVLSLVDRGFVYALAHIRGGQDLGRDWYENGKLLNKFNTFTDFVDVTDALVNQHYVASDQVFAQGGSAGGLLMGVVANIAPEKYRGIVANMPFVDVVTTMLDESLPLTTTEFDEWGDPKTQVYYDYMLSYSPYDQVKKQAYPAMLVTTGINDTQVPCSQPAKWVAKLRTMKTNQQPLLLRTQMESGHCGQSGRFAQLAEEAAEFAFILNLLRG